MKIKLLSLKTAEKALDKLLSQDLDIEISFPLSKLATAVLNEIGLQSVYTKERDRLIKKYGTKDEAGNISVQTTDQGFSDEHEKLLNMEVDLEFEPISISTLKGIKLSAFDVHALTPFIK